jgi:hypothetical protein
MNIQWMEGFVSMNRRLFLTSGISKFWLAVPDLAPQIMAYYYNKNAQAHGGHLEGVVDLKVVPEPVWGTLTRDFQMSLADKLQENPWQTEACIGHWHYDRAVFENHTYQGLDFQTQSRRDWSSVKNPTRD